MPTRGLKWIGWMGMTTVATLCVTTAMAQTAEAAREKSFFAMFFTSDNTVGLLNIWLLILMSIAVMALIIKGIMDNRLAILMPEDNIVVYESLLSEKRYSEAIERSTTDGTVFGRIMHASLSEASNGYGAMQRAVEEQADLLGAERVRALAPLDVMGAVGPMLGLFGTVFGMIVAFQTIVTTVGQPKPAQLAAGISTALVTTLWGLVVGIPAVAAASLLRTRIDGLMVEAMIQAEELISRFKPARKPTPKPKPKSVKK